MEDDDVRMFGFLWEDCERINFFWYSLKRFEYEHRVESIRYFEKDFKIELIGYFSPFFFSLHFIDLNTLNRLQTLVATYADC